MAASPAAGRPGGRAPTFDGDRCLLGRFAVSRCRACADACPRGALRSDERGLVCDESRCDGCGQCAPACSQGAIAVDAGRPAVRRERTGGTAFVVCHGRAAPAGEPRPEGEVACLATLSLADVEGLWRSGCRRIVAAAPCARCGRDGASTLAARVRLFSLMLSSRGEAAVGFERVPADAWRARFARAEALGAEGERRRGLISAFAAARPRARRDADGWLGLPTAGDGAVCAHRPRIDAVLCVGCDACARICPRGAIRIAPDAYVIESGRCDGCGLCADICVDAAIRIDGPGVGGERRIPTRNGVCARCGAPFREPEARPRSALCRICDRAAGRARLFQVLD